MVRDDRAFGHELAQVAVLEIRLLTRQVSFPGGGGCACFKQYVAPQGHLAGFRRVCNTSYVFDYIVHLL